MPYLPLFAGNVTRAQVSKSVDGTLFRLEGLELTPLFSAAHFKSFVEATFGVKNIPKDVLSELWQCFREGCGIPRLMDFLRSSSRQILGPNLENLQKDEDRRNF